MKTLRVMLLMTLTRQRYAVEALRSLDEEVEKLFGGTDDKVLHFFARQEILLRSLAETLGLTIEFLDHLGQDPSWSGHVKEKGDALRSVLEEEDLKTLRNIHQHLADYIAGKGRAAYDPSQFSMGAGWSVGTYSDGTSTPQSFVMSVFDRDFELGPALAAGRDLQQAIDERINGEVELAVALAEKKITQVEYEARLSELP